MENILEIMKRIPHRYPFLLVDKFKIISNEEIIGIKNVSINENYFQGHFPSNPIMPGVLIIEGMAQCGGILISEKYDIKNKLFYFASINKVKFRHPVIPGDQLHYKIQIKKMRTRICKFNGKAYVSNKLVCEAEMMASIVDKI